MSLDNEDLFVVQRDNTLFKVKSSDLKSTYASTAQVHVGDNPPANPVVGDLWWSSAQSNLFIWYDDGTSQQWVDASPVFVDLDYDRIEAYIDQYVDDNAVSQIIAGLNIYISPTTGQGRVTINADLSNVENSITTINSTLDDHEDRITDLEGGGGGPISVPDASETVKGIVQLATTSETTGGLDNTRAVHPAGLATALTTYAPKASPSFTGTPTAPTAASGTNNTQLATTAFVQSAVSNGGSGSEPSSASETVQGIVRLANDSETSNGTSRTLAVNPANLNSRLSNYATTSQLSNYATANDVQWHYTGGYLQPKNNTYQISNNGSILLGNNPADPEMLLGRAGTFKCSNDIQCMGASGLSVNTVIDNIGYGANFYKSAPGDGFARCLNIVSGNFANSFGAQIGGKVWGVAEDACVIGFGGDAGQPFTTTVFNSNGSFRMGDSHLNTYLSAPIAIYNTGTAYFTGQLNYGSINQISDSRFKRNITPANSQLADVSALGKLLKNFYYTDEAPVNDEVRATRRLGLLAQEAEIISPSLVKTEIREGRKESPGTPALTETRISEITGEEEEVVLCHEGFEITNTEVKSISTDALVFKLLGAISELNDEVQALKAEHATLMNNNGGSSGGY